MSLQAALYHARKRREAAARFGRFASLIATPETLTTAAAGNPLGSALTMPAASMISVSFSADLTAGQLTVDTNTSRTIGVPDLAADEIRLLGWFEKGVELTPDCAIAGTVTLYVLNEWTKPFSVATGVFT